MTRGKYVVIEGTDATGKSSQVERIQTRLSEQGIESVVFHEPGGTPISNALRIIIKDGSFERDALTNLLLFSASRHENWVQEGLSALRMGKWVLSARDYTSTLVYQGYGEGLDMDIITEITRTATDDIYMQPDHRIFLDIDDEAERLRRIAARGELDKPDTFESRDAAFQRRLIEGYREIARQQGAPIISAAQSIPKVTNDIWDIIR